MYMNKLSSQNPWKQSIWSAIREWVFFFRIWACYGHIKKNSATQAQHRVVWQSRHQTVAGYIGDKSPDESFTDETLAPSVVGPRPLYLIYYFVVVGRFARRGAKYAPMSPKTQKFKFKTQNLDWKCAVRACENPFGKSGPWRPSGRRRLGNPDLGPQWAQARHPDHSRLQLPHTQSGESEKTEQKASCRGSVAASDTEIRGIPKREGAVGHYGRKWTRKRERTQEEHVEITYIF
ncbi:hypothetical protein GGX14DRAFT_390134 [Mycena pura]|uniref:Uncharacterized protein n=1 Tax=Mycena pura TaxID=153505 RepID=A0AAD6VPI1_9AGAR|nr:hypothetical protein GGX14DRAFT_390134 [Mycena pura]